MGVVVSVLDAKLLMLPPKFRMERNQSMTLNNNGSDIFKPKAKPCRLFWM